MDLREPDEILAEFLRAEVTEVTRVGLSNRQEANNQTFSGDGAETEFTMTTQPVCVNSAVVDGNTLTKYSDYEIDLTNKMITFFTAPANDTNNVVITAKKTSSWVYPGKARDDLTKGSFPRIAITTLSMEGNLFGIGSTNLWNRVTMQVDIMAYHEQKCTINSETRTGQDVAEYISQQVITAIVTNLSGMGKRMQMPVLMRCMPMPFEEGQNVFRIIQEWSFQALDMNR